MDEYKKKKKDEKGFSKNATRVGYVKGSEFAFVCEGLFFLCVTATFRLGGGGEGGKVHVVNVRFGECAECLPLLLKRRRRALIRGDGEGTKGWGSERKW